MEGAVLGVRLALAAVFAVAGGAKLADRAGARDALADFGVPSRLAPAAAIALPLLELAVAAALLFPGSAAVGAAAALGLLVAFAVGIANALANDRAPDCHCFGQIHSAPAGRTTLLRNSALALAAGFVLWKGPGPSIGAWVEDRTDGELVLTAAAVALGSVTGLWGYRRSRRRGLERRPGGREWLRERSGLAVGTSAPDFELPGACGGRFSLRALRARGLSTVLIFSTTGCEGCAELYPHLRRWQETLSDRLTFAVLSVDDPEAARTLCEEHGIVNVMAGDDDLLRRYRAPGTPAAIVIARDGTIAGGAAVGRPMIEELIRTEIRRSRALSSSAAQRSARPQRSPTP